MAKFSDASKKKLETVHPFIRKVLIDAIEITDFTVVWGFRDRAAQELAFEIGASKARWGESPHNTFTSRAVDIAPFPIDWSDTDRFYLLAGIILGIAHKNGIKIRWGGDWDGDGNLRDQSLNDLGHFELLDDKEN